KTVSTNTSPACTRRGPRPDATANRWCTRSCRAGRIPTSSPAGATSASTKRSAACRTRTKRRWPAISNDSPGRSRTFGTGLRDAPRACRVASSSIMQRGLTGHFEMLSPRDAAFLYDEGPRNHEMLVACYVFDATNGSPSCASAGRLREWMPRRLGAADFFTRRIRRAPFDIGLPCWIPADPVLSEHVRLHRVAGGHAELMAAIADLASTRLDLSRPPWELHAITGGHGLCGLGEVTVIVLKVHHCAADGMGLRAAESALFSEGPVAAPRPANAPHPVETSMRALDRKSTRLNSS